MIVQSLVSFIVKNPENVNLYAVLRVGEDAYLGAGAAAQAVSVSVRAHFSHMILGLSTQAAM